MAMSRLIDITGQKFKYLVVLSRHGLDSTKKTTWLCQCDCGKKVVCTGLNLKSGNSKSCGCKKHLKGLENPRTITDPERLKEKKRALGTVKTWRKQVLKANPFCIKCGSKENLHVHHIVGFADSLHLRTDPNNGTTLCKTCHMDFHIKYGRRTGFSEADLNEFLGGTHERAPIMSTEDAVNGMEAIIIAYVTRYKGKHGVEDLQKARHYLDKLIETLTEDESWAKQTK